MDQQQFPYPLETLEEPPPEIMDLLVKNFSKRPEEKLSEEEIDTLSRYRGQLPRPTWEKWKKLGREERARRKLKKKHKDHHGLRRQEQNSEEDTPPGSHSRPVSQTTTPSPPPPPPQPPTTTSRVDEDYHAPEARQSSTSSATRTSPEDTKGRTHHRVYSGEDGRRGNAPHVPRSQSSPKRDRMEQRKSLYEATRNPQKYFGTGHGIAGRDARSLSGGSELGTSTERQESDNTTYEYMKTLARETESEDTVSLGERQRSGGSGTDVSRYPEENAYYEIQGQAWYGNYEQTPTTGPNTVNSHSELKRSRSNNLTGDGIAFNRSKSTQQRRSKSVTRGRGMKRPENEADLQGRRQPSEHQDSEMYYEEEGSEGKSAAVSVSTSGQYPVVPEEFYRSDTARSQSQRSTSRTQRTFPVAPGSHAALSYEKTIERPPPVLVKSSPADQEGAFTSSRGETASQSSGNEYCQQSYVSDQSEQAVSPQSPGSSVSRHRKHGDIVRKNIKLADSGAYRIRRHSQSGQKMNSPHSHSSPEEARGRRGSNVSLLSEENVSAAANRLYVSQTAATKHRKEAQERDARRRASIHNDEDLGRAQWIVGLREEMERNKESDIQEGTLSSHRGRKQSLSGASQRSGSSISRSAPRSTEMAPEEYYSSEYLSDLARVARTIRKGFSIRSENSQDDNQQTAALPSNHSTSLPNGNKRSGVHFSGAKLNEHASMLLNHLASTIRKARISYNSLREEALSSLQTHMKGLANMKALLAHRDLLCNTTYQEMDDWFGVTNNNDFVVSVESLDKLAYRSVSSNQLKLSTWILMADTSLFYQGRRHTAFSLEASENGVICFMDDVSRTTLSENTIDACADTEWARASGMELANEVFQHGRAVFMLTGPRKHDKLECLLGSSRDRGGSLFSATLHAMHNRLAKHKMEMRMNAISINNQGVFDLLHPDFAASSSPRKQRASPPKLEVADERGTLRLQSATSVRITSSDDVDILERVLYRRLRPESPSSEMWHTVADVADRYSHTVLVIDVLGGETENHRIVYRLCIVIFADGARIDSSFLSSLLRSAYFSQPEESAALTKVENAHKWAQQERVSFIRALEAWKNSSGDHGKKGVVSRASTLCRLIGKTLSKPRGNLTVCEVLPSYYQSQSYGNLNKNSAEQLLGAADTSDVDFELRFVEELNNMKERS
eukprot:gb/GECG01014053.1/.p1 GENE.gb/GECG01014053.1/~~gb/GECG01014053.1/.p1  ORF type:complete len:1182 (+),score=162.09 gb/GECG01014053.1/:1-3546(+)